MVFNKTMTLKRHAFFLMIGLLSLLILGLYLSLPYSDPFIFIIALILTVLCIFIKKKVSDHLIYGVFLVYSYYALYIFFNSYNFSPYNVVGTITRPSMINIYNSIVLLVFFLFVLLLTLMYMGMVIFKKMTSKKWVKGYMITNIMGVVLIISSFGALHAFFDVSTLDSFLYLFYTVMIAIILTFLMVGFSLWFYSQPSALIQNEDGILDAKTTYKNNLVVYLIMVGYLHYFILWFAFLYDDTMLFYIIPLTFVIIGNYLLIKYNKRAYTSFLPLIFIGYTLYLFIELGSDIIHQWFYTLPIAFYFLCLYLMLTQRKRRYFVGAIIIQTLYQIAMLIYIHVFIWSSTTLNFNDPFSVTMLIFYLFILAFSVLGYGLLDGYYKQKNNLIQYTFFMLFAYAVYAILFFMGLYVDLMLLAIPLTLFYVLMISLNKYRLKHQIEYEIEKPKVEKAIIEDIKPVQIMHVVKDDTHQMKEAQREPDRLNHEQDKERPMSSPLESTKTVSRSISLTSLIEIVFLIIFYQALSKDYVNFDRIIKDELAFLFPGLEMLSFSFGLSIIPIVNTVVHVLFFILFVTTIVLILIKSNASKWLFLSSLIVMTIFNILLYYLPYNMIKALGEFILDESLGAGINFLFVFRILGPLPYYITLYLILGYLIFFRKPSMLWINWIYPYDLTNMRFKPKPVIEDEVPLKREDIIENHDTPEKTVAQKPPKPVEKPVELSQQQIAINELMTQLQDLNDLLKRDIISQEDYATLKASVVEKMNALNTSKV